ncbi:MAG: hypothetical protein DIZ80_15200 [endosymbiont of Galathealinum brachiosum]|uniref:DUF302 domain-containing protein n=1 Tax=endosymbiont of Galathealinum brachiosum TaxID=2200906 RepID=A0A370D945_9GAMM|nr:MAG: hypothetical protein DIZ80_15200 [endosymbiont of Galathealinum brachiosum]
MKVKSTSTVNQWVKKSVCGGVLLALGLTMGSTAAVAGAPESKQGFKPFTPVSRIASMNVVRVKGQIDYTASYAKAREASVALATYVARMKEADQLGSDVIQGIDWKLGGTSKTCIDTRVCTDDEINHAVLAIPSPDPINPNDATYVETGVVTKANTKKANVLDFCNGKYAALAMGVDPITGSAEDGTGKYIVNGYSHAPALPCEVSIWLDEDKIYVDMLDPSAIFTLFFSDVLVSEEMADRDFRDALYAMPPQVKDEIKATIYAALLDFDPATKILDKKIGPVYDSMEDIIEVVASSDQQSPYKHVGYTKVDGGVFTETESKTVAQTIIDTLSKEAEGSTPGVHPTVIDEETGATLDSILSPKSSWRSARIAPISIPGKNHIIEACSPLYAKMAMSTGLSHVNALPCEITVKIIDGGTKLVISYLDPDFMLKSLFADISEEDKSKFGAIPGLIMTDLQNIVKAALEVNSGIAMNEGVQIKYNMLP